MAEIIVEHTRRCRQAEEMLDVAGIRYTQAMHAVPYDDEAFNAARAAMAVCRDVLFTAQKDCPGGVLRTKVME